MFIADENKQTISEQQERSKEIQNKAQKGKTKNMENRLKVTEDSQKINIWFYSKFQEKRKQKIDQIHLKKSNNKRY